MKSENPVERFKQKAEAVSAVVNDVKSIDEAFRYAVDLTKKQRGTTLVAAGFSSDEINLLKRRCESSGINFLSEPLRPHANRIHTALTRADWGIAETGTLVIDSAHEDTRIATMLSETHVAILPASRITADAAALKGEIETILKKDKPSYLAFITGASRTADIERVLAIGVHGPKELHILIADNHVNG